MTGVGSDLICPACGSTGFHRHPAPHKTRAMLSNREIVAGPLLRATCLGCGLGLRLGPIDEVETAEIYDNEYAAPFADRAGETQRANAVADLIRDQVAARPSRILDIGAGSGALMTALKARYPDADVIGFDPAGGYEQQSGNMPVLNADMDAFIASGPGRFDLVVSVNVAEHAPAPQEFLRSANQLMATNGTYVQITPDGTRPGSELLFWDHVSSFTPMALDHMARSVGLRLVKAFSLDGAMTEFMCAVISKDDRTSGDYPPIDPLALAASRDAYLKAVAAFVPPAAPYRIFGTGEAADLLACYARTTSEGADGYVVDAPVCDEYRGKPILPSDALAPGTRLVVAVHQRNAATISAKLKARGYSTFIAFEGNH